MTSSVLQTRNVIQYLIEIMLGPWEDWLLIVCLDKLPLCRTQLEVIWVDQSSHDFQSISVTDGRFWRKPFYLLSFILKKSLLSERLY